MKLVLSVACEWSVKPSDAFIHSLSVSFQSAGVHQGHLALAATCSSFISTALMKYPQRKLTGGERRLL